MVTQGRPTEVYLATGERASVNFHPCIGMIRYICWLEGICMLYWRPVHRRLKGIGAPCLQRFGAPCLLLAYHSFILQEIPLNSCIFFKAGMIPVILLL